MPARVAATRESRSSRCECSPRAAEVPRRAPPPTATLRAARARAFARSQNPLAVSGPAHSSLGSRRRPARVWLQVRATPAWRVASSHPMWARRRRDHAAPFDEFRRRATTRMSPPSRASTPDAASAQCQHSHPASIAARGLWPASGVPRRRSTTRPPARHRTRCPRAREPPRDAMPAEHVRGPSHPGRRIGHWRRRCRSPPATASSAGRGGLRLRSARGESGRLGHDRARRRSHRDDVRRPRNHRRPRRSGSACVATAARPSVRPSRRWRVVPPQRTTASRPRRGGGHRRASTAPRRHCR